MVPTMEEIEDYMESLEELFFTSLSAATPDLPHIREAVYRLWEDVSRYGPSIQDIRIPVLKDLQIPPPPPPVPTKSWLESSTDWIGKNPWKTSGIVVGVVGAGLLVGYGAFQRKKSKVIRVKVVAKERRQVVVVLGGDNPLGLPLIVDLEKQGYIVIVSVSSLDAVDAVERVGHGYVRALVLDPNELDTIPIFLRSISSTLSRRFPITASGDPHASPSSHPYVHSVISLLTLPSSTIYAPPAPLEHLSLRNTYLPYLNATHIAPLQVLQALLPLLRTTPARARDVIANGHGKKTIIVCLPAADARVGLPFASIQAMSAAATLRGVEVLRREINAASLTDKSETMKLIKLVVVDVGAVNLGSPASKFLPPEKVYKAMEDWTASEKLTYGPAFTSISPATASRSASRWDRLSSLFNDSRPFGIRRKPTDVAVFVDAIVGIVSSGGQRTSLITLGLGLKLGRIRNWFCGEGFTVGAGANTYRVASYLPSFLLDAILNIPHALISIRNALLPIPPALPQSSLPPMPPSAPAGPTTPDPLVFAIQSDDQESGNEASEASSEADVESNLGEGTSNSWVSLETQQP